MGFFDTVSGVVFGVLGATRSLCGVFVELGKFRKYITCILGYSNPNTSVKVGFGDHPQMDFCSPW